MQVTSDDLEMNSKISSQVICIHITEIQDTKKDKTRYHQLLVRNILDFLINFNKKDCH